VKNRLRDTRRAVGSFLVAGALVAGRGKLSHDQVPVAAFERAAAFQILQRYLSETESPSHHEDGSVSFEIDASLPKLKKHGIMRGLRLITGAGRVVFSQIHFVGDELIKTAVISRFLASQTAEGRNNADLAIADQNYRFRYAGDSSYNGRAAVVFRVEPRSRRVGLFRGELWIDRETARPLREWGEFVKSPSMFLSNIRFVRDYATSSLDSHPVRIILSLKAAFVGPAELTMWLSDPQHRALSPPAN
jgi:hypothetical protein